MFGNLKLRRERTELDYRMSRNEMARKSGIFTIATRRFQHGFAPFRSALIPLLSMFTGSGKINSQSIQSSLIRVPQAIIGEIHSKTKIYRPLNLKESVIRNQT
jgi:hypothetical protein